MKKRHEVSSLSSLIYNLLDPKEVELIDFGSGKGHLSRFLSVYHGFKVTTIELDQQNSKRAGEIDLQAIHYLSRSNKLNYYKSQNENLILDNLPKHLCIKVTSNGEFKLSNEDRRVSSIALHACGQLSLDLIELFKNGFLKSDFLFLISCCYHKCNLKNRFVLSNAVNELKINFIFETKEIACHAIEKYIDQLKSKYFVS